MKTPAPKGVKPFFTTFFNRQYSAEFHKAVYAFRLAEAA
jgi:hypothetical protein